MESRLPNRTEANTCLTSVDCVGYLTSAAHGPEAGDVQKHLDGCDRCRVLVAEAAHALFGDGSPAAAAPVRTLADAEVLGGRYVIKRFIARGGMGEVYEAADQALGEVVALKTLSPAMLDQGDAAARLIAEVRLARKVVHPNVCRILEFGLHRRVDNREVTPFLTMELLEGETLASRIRRTGPLGPREGERVLGELCAGLQAVHKAGIVHRDFKTENVFLVRGPADGEERAVVMDFGLAHALESQRSGGGSSIRALIGTVAYMAPEQFEGHRATPAFDIYALGIVAFEMMTGRLPFVADTPMAAATLRLRQDAPPPSSIRPELGPAWDAVIGRCLAREAGDRFADATAIGVGLGQALAAPARALPDSGATARPPRSAGPGLDDRGRGRRRGLVMAAGGALLAAAGLAIALASSFGKPAGAPAVSAPAVLAPAPGPAATARAPAPAPTPPVPAVAAAPTGSAPVVTAKPPRRPVVKAPRRSPSVTAPVAAPVAPHHPEDPGAEGDDDLIDPFAHRR